MPHYTLAYNFQNLVLGWAREYSEKHSPVTQQYLGHTDSFLAVSEDNFENVTIYWASAGEEFRTENKRLEGGDASFIFYDHFDPGDFCYIAWQNLSQESFEGLIGRKLTPEDFGKNGMAVYMRTPPEDYPPEKGFPNTGSCMGPG